MPTDIGKDAPRPTNQTEHKTFPQQLREKIAGIFQRDNLKPSEKLHQLASQKIPEDIQQEDNKIPETSSEITIPIPDTTQQDQAEIAQIDETIKGLREKTTPQSTETTPEAPLPKLFPDRPSLYEQHHKEYKKDRRTIKGAIQRRIDIHHLKKEGVKNPTKTYDALRARGILGNDIIKELNETNDRTKRHLNLHGKKPLTLEEKIVLLKKTPNIIDRLDSINNYYSFNLESLSNKQSILDLSDQEFQQRRQQLKPLFFLDNDTAFKYISNPKQEPIVSILIDYSTSNSPEKQKIWENFSRLNNINFQIAKVIFSNETNPNIFFNQNGHPTELLFNKINSNLYTQFFISNLTPETVDSFSLEKQTYWKPIATSISKTDNNSINAFIIQSKELISKKINSSPNPQEALNQYISIIEQVHNSPSKEILKIKDQLLIQILNSDNPLEAYQKISNIFIQNNLPTVGKIYKVFDVLYPTKKLNSMLTNPILSRVLVDNYSPHLRHTIIFNDLLKVNLGSGETSLVSYLNLFQTSSPILEKARNGQTLNQAETQQLSIFFKKLNALYDSSLLSRIQTVGTLDTPTLQSKIDQLYQKYKVQEGQTIDQRVSQMYLSGLGLKSTSEALNYIQRSKESAHQRNLSETDFSFKKGDLIKSVGSENLSNILNFGCVAGEYLGSKAGSDVTPFDTDTIRVNSPNPVNKITSIETKSYGDLFVIVKDRGQLQDTTDMENPKYDPTKLEIFYSGVADKNHYGVRTGFPSSEIDFLVTTDISPQKLENIYYQIAKHGVYIPVLDSKGNQIFTPEDYQRYRHSFDGVIEFNGDPIKIELSQPKDRFYSEINKIKKGLESQTNDEISQTDTQIREKIKTILDELGINLKDLSDTSLLGARLFNIGSSGRRTNLPNDFDFDYTIVLDPQNYSKSNSLTTMINKEFSHQDEIPAMESQIRLTGVNNIGTELLDLDIGINTVADTITFPSHEAIEQKLESIKQNYGEGAYYEVIANILLTKKILKENHAYKKGDVQDGGFGGIGTENWILSNNGNIQKAFETFWQTAHKNNRELTLDEFKRRYLIFNAGKNLRHQKDAPENYIAGITEKGYQAILRTIKKYI